MKISDRDWDLLSAYADDEIDVGSRSVLETRLACEPELAVELDRIFRSKKVLRRLRPAPPQAVVKGPLRRARGLAIAASVAAAIGISFAAFWASGIGSTGKSGDQASADWHSDFATKSYVIERDGVVKLAAGASLGFVAAPDLSASNLVLVDVKLRTEGDRETVAMHYRGYRGCRLTLVAEQLGTGQAAKEDYPLFREWTTDKARFSLIADTMDPARFEAIAAFVEAQIRAAEEKDRLRVALADATASAAPCA